MQKVLFKTLTRPTKTEAGSTQVINAFFSEDRETVERQEVIGTIQRLMGGATFTALKTDGELVGEYASKSKAGHALQRAVYGDPKTRKPKTVAAQTPDHYLTSDPIATLADEILAEAEASEQRAAFAEVSRDEASKLLGCTKSALSKRISRRGGEYDFELDGVTYIVK